MIKTIIKTLVPTLMWNYLRLKYLKYSMKHFSPYIVEKNYSGHVFKSYISDGLSKGWYDQDWSPLPEVDLLKKKILVNGSLVFDIGAHQGIVAQILAKTIGTQGKVVAVEANPHNFKTFKKNIDINQVHNIEVIHAAISDKEGVLFFNENPNGSVDDGNAEWGRVETQAITIDYLVKKYGVPDLVFLDVEGFEEHALIGATQSFNLIKAWFIEVHNDYQLQSFGGSVEKILTRFPESHYELFVANEENRDFVSLDLNQPDLKLMLEKRFFLIAMIK